MNQKSGRGWAKWFWFRVSRMWLQFYSKAWSTSKLSHGYWQTSSFWLAVSQRLQFLATVTSSGVAWHGIWLLSEWMMREKKNLRCKTQSFYNQLSSDILSCLPYATVTLNTSGALWIETTQRFEYQEVQIIGDHPRGLFTFLGNCDRFNFNLFWF